MNVLVLLVLFYVSYTGASVDETLPDEFFNSCLEEQNPSLVNPPKTDKGAQSYKYPFTLAKRNNYPGGWTRQVNLQDFPIAQKVAGAQQRLFKGGVRQMHWHVCSEWGYMVYGHARITAVDQQGRAFVTDVKAGDVWFFPQGIPHSIQGIGDNGAFYVLAFDDGSFNTLDTFMLNDWMTHVPKEVLAKNFQVSKSTFNNIPQNDTYIFEAHLPESLNKERKQVFQGTGKVPQSYAFSLDTMQPNVTRKGGQAKIIDANNFPVTEIAASVLILKPGAMRELHWHPNADEWQYFVKGYCRVGVFAGAGQARTMDVQAGDINYIPQSVPHYVQNIGDVDCVSFAVFPTSFYEDISLAEWLAHTPPLLVNEHIKTGQRFIKSIDKKNRAIVP